ncbi:MAG: hypothetical protein A2X23_13245 [Chloroflexi bacterium GWC2_73_18]|nr:MAG: hypothetical protein A2X23_13245 [Chloroflexi bacterium GWC2_73_18]
MARFTYGGQALIEGVLMRGRDAIAVALRHPDGSIVYATESLDGPIHRNRLAKLPLFRGLVVLYETLVIGFRWLSRSANVAASAEGVELGRGSTALMLVLALVLGIGLFFLLPLLLSQLAIRGLLAGFVSGISGPAGNPLLEHLLEGLIRLAIFVAYLLAISLAADIRRVFAYHGAEHMTIHALEHGDPLVPEAVRRYPTAHQRCGTEFVLVVVVLSILVFSLLAGQNLLVSVVGRIALIPVIVAVSYELLRFGARHRANRLVRWIYMPGIWLQMITTRQPDDSMIEVAIVSMTEALRADGETIPDGTVELARRPLDAAVPGSASAVADPPVIAVDPPAEAGP